MRWDGVGSDEARRHRDGAQAYVDRGWSEACIKQRYEWLFTYDVTSVAR